MRLEHIELERLSVSPANMRARHKASDIAAILPSVRERGVLVPVLVRPNGYPDAYEIVAGRRRFLAAKAVAEERGEALPLPCAVMDEDEDAAAIEASLIENVARLDPDEVAQWETFARLVREGRAIEDIAATFGVTERQVRRILALGNLSPRIRSLYRKGMIDAATARHLTLATKAQQREWLALYDSPDGYAATGHRLKEWLFGGEAIPTSIALFDLATYAAPIVTDLFGEDSYFSDAEAFWTLQREAVEAKRSEYLEAGWSAVDVIEPGRYFEGWEFEKRSRARGGKVYIALSARGEVEVYEGWLPRKEARQTDRTVAPPAPPRPELTSPLRAYVDLHRHAAVRAALTEQPDVALRLALAHAIAGSTLWSLKVEQQRADRASIAESVETCASKTAFDAKRRPVLDLLGFDPGTPTVTHGTYEDASALFGRLLALSDEETLSILAIVMGETLAAGSPVVEAVGVHLGVDMAASWRADEAFFELVRDREVLTAMVAEVAGAEAAEANAGEKGKALKAIIRDSLKGENGRARVADWAPVWMRFPAGSYLTPAVPVAEASPGEVATEAADWAKIGEIEAQDA